MWEHTYTCPVCGNQVELMGCPFDDSLVGQCDKCNLKIDILKEDYSLVGQCKYCNLKINILVSDYEEWKEVKSDGS